jgi:hypothetical protein
MATVLERVTSFKPKVQVEAGTIHWLNQCIERGKTEVFSETVVMTPAMAAELLRRNPDNRSIKAVKVQQFAADMRAGRWPLNGENIIISKCGLLNDGQHRCAGLIDANVCLPMVVQFGIEREARTTIDQGSARGAGDYLSMGRVENAISSATIARIIIAFEKSNGQHIETRLVTNAEVMERVAADPKIAKAAHFAVTVGRKAQKYAAGTLIGFCYYAFSAVDEEEAVEFLCQVCEGTNLKAMSPALVVREKLLAIGRGGGRNPKVALLFRAWNFYRRGVKVKPNSMASIMPLPALI